MQTATFTVHPSRVADADDAVKALTKQAGKVGALFTASALSPVQEDDGTITYRLTIAYEPISLPGGWTLGAIWDVAPDGISVSAVPGAPEGIVARTRDRATAGTCEHCQQKRDRRFSIAVVNHEGVERVVGSSCVRDFLGVNPAHLLGWLDWEQTLADLEEGDEDPGWGGGGGWSRLTASPAAFIATARAVIRDRGFVPKSKAEVMQARPTSEVVLAYMFGRSQWDSKLRGEIGPVTAEDREVAQKIVDYFASFPGSPDNDYLYTLGLLCEQSRVPSRNAGFLASAVTAYQRDMEREATRRQEKAESAPIPVNGERIRVRGTVLTTREQMGDYGLTIKMLVKHEDGWKIWGTVPSAIRGVNIGDVVEFDAKIEPSRDDATFGFASRPTKAKIIR